MRESEGPRDVARGLRGSEFILDALRCDTLSELVDFLLSLLPLSDGIANSGRADVLSKEVDVATDSFRFKNHLVVVGCRPIPRDRSPAMILR